MVVTAFLRMAFLLFKADLKARMECHRFYSRHYQCKKICERCDAERMTTDVYPTMCYTNMSESAPYKATTKSHSEYLASTQTPSFWMAMPGFQLESCSYDWMHLVYLGVARDLMPSALKLLQHLGFHYVEGESVSDYLQRATLDMQMTCKEHGLYLPRSAYLTVANCNTFGKEDYAELGSRFKASHVKTMTWWIQHRVQKLADASEPPSTMNFLNLFLKLRFFDSTLLPFNIPSLLRIPSCSKCSRCACGPYAESPGSSTTAGFFCVQRMRRTRGQSVSCSLCKSTNVSSVSSF